MDWLDYREKLGIGFNDKDKVAYFKSVLFNVIDYLGKLESQITTEECMLYCNITGTSVSAISRIQSNSYYSYYEAMVRLLSHHSDKLENLLAYYVAFVNCQTDSAHKRFKRIDFINILCKALTQAHILYEVFEDKDGYFIFPKGVPEFDNALVSQPLHWLSKYPNAEKAWSKALRAYSEATDENASDVADKFRKALETFFQEFFGERDMSLEKSRKPYGTYLKLQGIPAEISNNFEALHSQYAQYMNHYAKHRDATSDKVLEYLMYQTGNIMRLLITLKQEETTNAD